MSRLEREESGEIVGPIIHELEHNSVVDRWGCWKRRISLRAEVIRPFIYSLKEIVATLAVIGASGEATVLEICGRIHRDMDGSVQVFP